MGYFPFFVDIENKICLIAGGGNVALRKIKRLIPYGPIIRIVAPEICDEIKSINYDRLFIEKRLWQKEDLSGCLFVIAATDCKKTNKYISDCCYEANILVNVVDSKEESGFIFPSIFKCGALSVGITSGGSSPNLAVYYRNILEKNTPSAIEDILEFMDKIRPMAKERISDQSKRSDFFKKCLEICISINGVISQKALEELFEKYENNAETAMGFVHIVGAGCSSSDLITVRGLNLVQNADVIIYDDLIAEELLDTARESCEKIYVGKRGGLQYMPQEEITALIIEKARMGKTVVRLKGGDPFVFGRGSEEIMSLIENDIPFGEVPGITSAIAIPAEAGIPVTHRELSRSLHIITGHTSKTEDTLPENMEILAALNGTLVFVMGLSNLDKICRALMENGKDKNTPAAVISGGNSKNKFTVRSSLENISDECKKAGVKSPAVIVIGKTAALRLNR